MATKCAGVIATNWGFIMVDVGKRILRVLLTIGGIVVLVLTVGLNAATAVATEHDHSTPDPIPPDGLYWDCQGNSYAYGCFAPLGDWFEVYDRKADGYSNVLRWRLWNRELTEILRQGVAWDTYGSGVVTWENKDLTENTGVEWSVCRGEHSTHTTHASTCTPWRITGTG
jgi:hypothetical protein